jgi:hypothetical protein
VLVIKVHKMSMYADLVTVITVFKNKHNLSNDQAIELFVELMGCMQWDFDDVDSNANAENFDEQEYLAAKKALGL